MLCFVVVMQSFIMNSHEVFIHIHQGCFAGTGAIVRLPQCQWSKPDGYGKISQCITTTKHSKAKTVCILLGIYCTYPSPGFNEFSELCGIVILPCFCSNCLWYPTWTEPYQFVTCSLHCNQFELPIFNFGPVADYTNDFIFSIQI